MLQFHKTQKNSNNLPTILLIVGALFVEIIGFFQLSAKAQLNDRPATKPNIEQPRIEPVEPLKPSDLPLNPNSIPRPEPINEDVPDIYVKGFQFLDNTVFNSKILEKVISSYKNRKLTFTERRSLLKDLTAFYVRRGYSTSAAAILVQDNLSINSEVGILKIRMIEGRIGSKTILGTKRLKNYVSWRTGKENTVFNINRLTEQLIRLQNDPLIKKLSIDFSKGEDINVLNEYISIVPSKNYNFTISQNNFGGESSGTFQTEANISLLNLTTLGDKFSLTNIYSDGGNQFSVRYQVPLAPDNSTISIGYTTNAIKNITAPFEQINLKDSFQNYFFELSHPIYNHTTTKNHIDYGIKLALDNLIDQGSILNLNFPTLRGSDNSGLTKVTFIRFTQYFQIEDRVQALSLQSVLNQGIGLYSHTAPNFPHDSFYWTGDFYYQRKVNRFTTFITKGGLQISADPLPSLVQFGLGGRYTVRGYKLNESAHDNGVHSNTELRFLIYSSDNHKVFLTPFIDIGYGWNTSIGNLTPIYLGTGAMFDYIFSNRINANFGIGIPLIDQDTQSVQGTRLFFNLKFSF